MESTNSGLYTTHLSVRQNEAAAYEAMREKLLIDLRPLGAFEESLAVRIINANWRLRRCDAAESAIPVLAFDPNAQIHDFEHAAQAAINRARIAAENTIRRTSRDLSEL